MLALRKRALGDPTPTLELIPEPTLRAGHAIVQVAAAGICGTDVHILHDEYRCEPPVTLGHEVAGTIAALAPDVEGFRVGDRVVSETYFSTCGRCPYCRDGRPNLCSVRRSIGSFEDGAFAARVLVPAHNLHPLPDTIGFPEAALIEPLACVVRGLLELGRVDAGDRAAITGPGPIGLLALQVAKAAGARVVMLGTRADAARLALATRLGADGVGFVDDDPRALALRTLGAEPNLAIECSGATPAAPLLLDLLAKGGRFIQIGLYGRAVTLDMDLLCTKELRFSGSFATTPSSWERALSLAAGGVSLRALVGATFPLAEAEAAFAAVAARVPGKVLLIP
jgi:L-iditol 2-dehydrogenase